MKYILFADDTSILYSNNDIFELTRVVNNELLILSDWFKANKLSLNIEETNYMLFGPKFNAKKYNQDLASLNINIEGKLICRVEYTKFLGVIVDSKLNWEKHINYISMKLSKTFGVLSRIRRKLTPSSFISLYYCLIYSNLNYCIIVWGTASKSLINKLFILQKRAVRLIVKAHFLASTSPIFKQLNILKLYDIYLLSCSLFMFKYKCNLLPESCKDLIILSNTTILSYCSKLRIHNEFHIPSHRTSLREKCIKIRGPKIWKFLPNIASNLFSINTFKHYCKKLMFSKC